MKTLKLFNAVLSKDTKENAYISSDYGFIIEPNAIWAKDQILNYFKKEKLSGNDLNKSFHKSWEKIKNSSRFELLLEQITHYMSTYGSNFQDEVYIPDEILNVPDLKLSYKVIKAYSKEEMTNKCLSLLKSGIALTEETINDILTILVDTLDYTFTGGEGIRNKEAIIKIADLYGVVPTDTMEFFRYIIYKSTGQSLLIKNKQMYSAISNSNFNPAVQFNKFGLEKLSQIFNRFKPLFMSYKKICPKTINKISKLSKVHHKPLVENPLNKVSSRLLTNEDMHWLNNATPFALFKALQVLHSRMNDQTSFVYRIRNGKSWTEENHVHLSDIYKRNFDIIVKYLKNKYDFSGKKIYIPKNVKYALPTSEKMYVGNIPTGTRFNGKKLAVGIYWENSWGARDLDLSGMNIGGKIGWNSSYNQNNGSLMYSGDITSAPNGAVEYLYANKGLNSPTLVLNNVFSGSDTCDYKIIVGKGDKISNKFMMDPNNLFAEVKCKSVQNQSILGIFIPKKDKQTFVVLNFGAGHAQVSGSKTSDIATKALFQQWNNPYTLNKLVKLLGAKI
ncbi:hypothetical protein M0Q97_10225, partial [Candidatus Dojkabacteria bacterium]|nr:hypothetical protein [Candidatus Dojkabacteria bacterium]